MSALGARWLSLAVVVAACGPSGEAPGTATPGAGGSIAGASGLGATGGIGAGGGISGAGTSGGGSGLGGSADAGAPGGAGGATGAAGGMGGSGADTAGAAGAVGGSGGAEALLRSWFAACETMCEHVTQQCQDLGVDYCKDEWCPENQPFPGSCLDEEVLLMECNQMISLDCVFCNGVNAIPSVLPCECSDALNARNEC